MSLATKFGLLGVTALAACGTPQQRPATPNAASINSSGAAAIVHQPASPMRCELDTVERGPMIQGAVIFDEGDAVRKCTTRGQKSSQPLALPTIAEQMTNSALRTAQRAAQAEINGALKQAIGGIDLGF